MAEPLGRTVAQITRRVQRLFGDEAEAQITKADILEWINDAQLDIARKTECLKQRAQTNAVSNDGSYELPEDFLSMHRITYKDKPLKQIPFGSMDNYAPGREVGPETGEPHSYYLWGRTLFIYPAPASSSDDTLDIFYVRMPTELTLESQRPEIPPQFHEEIVRYCLARAKELDDDEDSAAAKQADYDVRLTQSKFEANVGQADSFPAVRLVPGDD